jgi:hypothetical protein
VNLPPKNEKLALSFATIVDDHLWPSTDLARPSRSAPLLPLSHLRFLAASQALRSVFRGALTHSDWHEAVVGSRARALTEIAPKREARICLVNWDMYISACEPKRQQSVRQNSRSLCSRRPGYTAKLQNIKK